MNPEIMNALKASKDRKPKKYCHVWGKYYIDIDDRQYSLYSKSDKKDKDGNDVYYDERCNANHLGTIINQIIRNEQANAELENINQLFAFTQNLIKQLQDVIENAITFKGGK